MKQKISYILFLFTALFAYSQVTLEVSDVKEAKINQKFTLNVLLEISGENMEQQTPLRMPDLSKFEIIGTASEQNTIVLDAKKGDVVNQMVYQLVLTPKQSGKIKFGSVLVTVNGKIYKTEPFDINVREAEKKSLAVNNERDEVYLNLEIQDKVLYKDESTVAVLRAYSRDYGNFRKVGNIKIPQQKNLHFKTISNTKSEIESSGGMNSQVIATYIIFPSESGNILINPVFASISAENKIKSNSVKLNVKKLPEGMPESFKNAVGNFDLSVSKNDADKISEIEKPINVTLKISGTGNFGTLQLPKILESENYISYPPKITEKIIPQKNNLFGNISADYVVIPKKPGEILINFEDFSFFDPEQQKYIELGEKSIALNVKTAEQIADAKTTIEKVNEYTNTVLETVNTPVLKTRTLKVKERNGINWKIVIGNFALVTALLSLFLLVRKRTKQRRKRKSETVLTKPISTIAETEEIIRKNMNIHFDDYIEYLKKLKENKDFTKFFSTYEELNREAKNIYSIETESDFRKFLEKTKGQKFAEEYCSVSEKIQIEKYAPFHSDEYLEELLNSVITLYSEIKN